MSLEIVQYGHPVLRQKGDPIASIDEEIQRLIEAMFVTMYEASGIGLAAQQIGRALQLTVIDVREVTDRPSTLEMDGQTADVAGIMPLVLINPEIHPVGNSQPGPEGCLSFPDIYADIARPEFVEVKALNQSGDAVSFKAGGLLSRAIQHEIDHLNGILFIDRMPGDIKEELKPELELMRKRTQEMLKKSKV